MDSLVGRAVIAGGGIFLAVIVIILVGLLSFQAEQQMETKYDLISEIESLRQNSEKLRIELLEQQKAKDEAQSVLKHNRKQLLALKGTLGVPDISTEDAINKVSGIIKDNKELKKSNNDYTAKIVSLEKLEKKSRDDLNKTQGALEHNRKQLLALKETLGVPDISTEDAINKVSGIIKDNKELKKSNNDYTAKIVSLEKLEKKSRDDLNKTQGALEHNRKQLLALKETLGVPDISTEDAIKKLNEIIRNKKKLEVLNTALEGKLRRALSETSNDLDLDQDY